MISAARSMAPIPIPGAAVAESDDCHGPGGGFLPGGGS